MQYHRQSQDLYVMDSEPRKHVNVTKGRQIKMTRNAVTVKQEKGAKRKLDPTEAKPLAKKIKQERGEDEEFTEDDIQWDINDELANSSFIEPWVARNIIQLIEEENTIPFIARYRKEMTKNMEASQIREVQETYETLKSVRSKAVNVAKTVAKEGKMTPDLKTAFKNVRTIADVEHLYAPFKAGSKRTLAERARQIGLEPITLDILNGKPFNLQEKIQTNAEGLTSLANVETGVKHIIADIISKDQDLLKTIQETLKTAHVMIESTKSRTAGKKETACSEKIKTGNNSHGKEDNSSKFELYQKFTASVLSIKSHQVLAINRGESLKVLSVKTVIPNWVKENFLKYCQRKWIEIPGAREFVYRSNLIASAAEDSYTRLVEPLLCRQIRSEVTKKAEKVSIQVFMTNLRHLLLAPPVRGKPVLGIDPGFKNGCKLALISPTGDVLETSVVYLPFKDSKSSGMVNTLKNLCLKHNSEIIALGNGTACRETESLLSDMLAYGYFRPLNVQYCVVNETGASIYSVTDEAVAEMPNLDPNLRSAVSIARRLQDPLAEYVKIEPKHLGVGMYQHDVPENMLKTALNDIVVECVSFVGVNLNTGSEALLRKVAGLSAAKAKSIVKWRAENGRFVNREQLHSVKGLGPKSFQQCAGFVRIVLTEEEFNNGETIDKKKNTKNQKNATISTKPNYLDRTCIHPESYDTAYKFLELIDTDPSQIGTPNMIGKVKSFIKISSVPGLAETFNIGEPSMKLIIDGLCEPLGYDMRSEFQKPLFKKGVLSMEELKPGTELSGRVMNIVPFGAFVDIGVSRSGLIHVSKLRNTKLNLGDRVNVRVENVDLNRGRIGLIPLN